MMLLDGAALIRLMNIHNKSYPLHKYSHDRFKLLSFSHISHNP